MSKGCVCVCVMSGVCILLELPWGWVGLDLTVIQILLQERTTVLRVWA